MAISRSLYQLAREEMDQLARDTGGRTFQATDLYAARTAFEEVAAEIGRQYSLGYYSSNKTRDGRFRQIRVDVRGIAGAQVSAREGYKRTQGNRGLVKTKPFVCCLASQSWLHERVRKITTLIRSLRQNSADQTWNTCCSEACDGITKRREPAADVTGGRSK